MNPNKGNFNFSGKGWIAVCALVIVGGGALAFHVLRNDNQIQIDNKSEGGSVGDINVNPSIGTQQQQTDSSGTQQANSASDSENSQPSQNTPTIDIEANQVAWTLKFPVYQKESDSCNLLGKESITLMQNQSSLRNSISNSNGYGTTKITGTIRASGKADLSLDGGNGRYFLTFEGALDDSSNSSETVISGKVTAPNCPEENFELVKAN